jgi:hypothetical protein
LKRFTFARQRRKRQIPKYKLLPKLPPEHENQLSRMPCFNSQTRNAARINRFVRAIVPIPGNPGSPDSALVSRRLFRFDHRLGATSEERRPNVAISTGGFSLQVGCFIINWRPGMSLEELQSYYPKGRCRFVNHNLSTACYDRVSKMEQFCKLYAVLEFFPGWAALV